MVFEKINKILSEISSLLQSSSDIIEFSKLISKFNGELNSILQKYHEGGLSLSQESMRPHLIFYRMLFQDLIAASMDEQVLEDMKDLLIQEISNQNRLIEEKFTGQAHQETMMIKDVKPKLEECLKKRLQIEDDEEESS